MDRTDAVFAGIIVVVMMLLALGVAYATNWGRTTVIHEGVLESVAVTPRAWNSPDLITLTFADGYVANIEANTMRVPCWQKGVRYRLWYKLGWNMYHLAPAPQAEQSERRLQ